MNVEQPLRIAAWSGPRNISTAMMRAWENRPDTVVCDEPFYAHYLTATGLLHPGAEEVIAAGETDWRKVAQWLTREAGCGAAIFYQKHMTHHMLPHIDRGWMAGMRHLFLIRDPADVLVSYSRVIDAPTLADTGLPQQVELFEWVAEHSGQTPPVIDARDVLEHPRAMLEALCTVLGVAFSEAMLAWPPGPRPTDGVWAKHWYHAVERSTGFTPFPPKTDPLPDQLAPLYEQCMVYYEPLYAQRIRV